HLSLEEDLTDWLDGRQKPLLSVSGPTKSGKTVLIRKLVQDPISLSGGAIDTAMEFWEAICDELEVFTDHSLSVAAGSSDSVSVEGKASAVVAEASAAIAVDRSAERGVTRGRASSPRAAARKALRDAGRVVFIDDFHYIDSDEQLQIVRGLKDLIFDGLGVVVAAVPHRAYDVVRVEKEMTARVRPLPVVPWEEEDLKEIARKGFDALAVQVSASAVGRMAQE
ncbi:MAG: AAA family ATPase, partial [Curtobacterium sp.]